MIVKLSPLMTYKNTAGNLLISRKQLLGVQHYQRVNAIKSREILKSFFWIRAWVKPIVWVVVLKNNRTWCEIADLHIADIANRGYVKLYAVSRDAAKILSSYQHVVQPRVVYLQK